MSHKFIQDMHGMYFNIDKVDHFLITTINAGKEWAVIAETDLRVFYLKAFSDEKKSKRYLEKLMGELDTV